MSLRYPGGLITKNPVVPSTSSAAGIWTLEQALEYIKAGTWPSTGDPYFEYVTLLLHGNGTNGAQNNTFLDSSTNAFTITRNGNATQGTFSPFSRADGGFSNYFDGDGDYLTWAGTTLSGNFTVECWVYKTAVDGSGYTNVFYGGGNDQFGIDQTTAGSISLVLGASTVISASGTAVTLNTWHHLAWVREGSTCRAYVNGVQQGTGTSSASFTLSTIGRYGLGGYEMNGYISNVRITNACLYPSGTTFTPSTTPFTTTVSTGTVQLLTCQSNRFKDNSTNNFTITQNGNVSVQAFGPFNPTTVYSTTANGGSGYFDGSGDYLTVPDNAAFDMGTGDFTLETWVYITSIPDTTGQAIFGDVNGYEWYMYSRSSGNLEVGMQTFAGGYSQIYTTNNYVKANQWAHIAVARQSGTLRIFVNGVQCTTTGSMPSSLNISATINIARSNYNNANFIYGYLSDLRVVKGTAVYTANFTPPTAPLTAISGTSFLMSGTNGGIFDNAAMNDLETVGNAQISTAQSKFGGGSMYFDGTGDYLYEPFSTNFNLGTGSYTIEMWVRPAAVADRRGLFAVSGGSGSVPKFVVHLDSGTPTIHYNGLTNGANINTAATSSVSANAWTHIAFCRNGSTWYWFINGTQSGTGSNSTDITFTTQPSYVGYGGEAFFAEFNGYIDDLRITKGYARYTANFTPPTAPFADK